MLLHGIQSNLYLVADLNNDGSDWGKCNNSKKAQGQSLRYVGIYLPKPVFSHGQLYVAVSREKSFAGLKVFTSNGRLTQNVVYREVLT